MNVARYALLLTTFAALAAWAGAQGPAPSLTAADQLRLFKSNRALLDNLVDHGVKMSAADTPLARAEECRRTALTLATYTKRAATEDQNPDRVAELANLLGEVVREGLAPNLDEAKRTFPPESRQAKRVGELRDTTKHDLDAVRAAIPAGKVGDNAKVQAALARLAELRAKFGE